MKYIGIIGIGLLLLLCTLEDIKTRRLNLWHILIIVPFIIFDLVERTIIEPEVSWIGRVSGLIIGIIFIVLSKLTKGQIGMGDGILISVIGVMLGGLQSLEVITYSFFASSIVAIILLTFFKMGKKKTIPFVPFLLLGYIMSIFLGGI